MSILPPPSHRSRLRRWASICAGLLLLGLLHGLLYGIGLASGAPLLAALNTPTPTPDQSGGEDDTAEEQAGGPTIYVVQEGDTLWDVAYAHGLTLDALVAANALADPNVVQPGQELVIPGTDFEPPTSPATLPAATATPRPPATSEAAVQPPIRPTLAAAVTPIARPQPTAAAADGPRSVCPANVVAYDLALPGDPIYLLLAGDWLYLIANGDLYRLAAADLAAGQPPPPENMTPAGRKVGKYAIRELVYAAPDPATGDLLLLDKSDDVFRYTTAGEWSLPFPATQVPGQFPDPQFLAVQPAASAEDGAAFVLDADLSTVWQLSPGSGLPHVFWTHDRLLDALDMHAATTAEGDTVFTLLMRDGGVLRWSDGELTTIHRPSRSSTGARPWLSHLLALDDGLAVVDAQERTITALDMGTGDVLWEVDFRLPGMPQLRSAALAGDTVFAVAGRTLYVGDLAAGSDCPRAAFDDRLYFQGEDLLARLPELGPPFPGVVMPERPRSYPGARRLYRNGVHEGVDLYGTDAPGVGLGSRVNAIADGAVMRADGDFVEMLPAEYEAAIARTFAEHRTPPDLTDAFLGRQVHVLHGPGVESRYGHLSAIAPGIAPDVAVAQGETVGRVGVSGTSAGAYGTTDGVHLHFEIWIDGRYLGEGVSLYETMRLWQALFGTNG